MSTYVLVPYIYGLVALLDSRIKLEARILKYRYIHELIYAVFGVCLVCLVCLVRMHAHSAGISS